MPAKTSLPRPRLPIPPPLRAAEAGTWANHTVTVRLAGIARRVLAENDFPAGIAARLNALIAGLPHAPIRPLTDPSAPDAAGWNDWLAPWLGQSWLEVPWFLAEVYFYRRILEAGRYFEPGPTAGLDPFAAQKQQGLETTRPAIRDLAGRLDNWLARPNRREAGLADLLAANLWGNRADLSLWPAGSNAHPQRSTLRQDQTNLLVDDTAAVTRHLLNGNAPARRVDFLIDNAGFELAADLCLADFLLGSGLSAAVQFNLKSQPTFVSDALAQDVLQTIDFLTADDHPSTRALALRLKGHHREGRLRLRPHPFWTSPLSGWEMPAALRGELAQARLVISKGDAHYRRLLGDCHWPFTTPFGDIVCYFPASLAALRTLKSEVAAGLRPEQVDALPRQDPHWLTNGRRGIIQFYETNAF